MQIMLEVSKEKLIEAAGERIAELIIKNREHKIKIEPGYDGVYGKPIFNGGIKKEVKKYIPKQKSLGDY
jgi:PHP family Zn ribbon phosphoesterase